MFALASDVQKRRIDDGNASREETHSNQLLGDLTRGTEETFLATCSDLKENVCYNKLNTQMLSFICSATGMWLLPHLLYLMFHQAFVAVPRVLPLTHGAYYMCGDVVSISFVFYQSTGR